MIVATAGHVDHGKTLLIKSLTGIDTDKLAEEKRRGLSIDLGFAYIPLANGDNLGFVDVPGHEQFIRNMLCGVAAIDFALVVVAADDGLMPQTIEHVAILDLLGIRCGAVALTKIDRVDDNRTAYVADEIFQLLQNTTLAGAPLFPVSAVTQIGIEPLRYHLEQAAAVFPTREISGNFRLAIDRHFVIPGTGLVVTGAVFGGEAHIGDRLILSPRGDEVRVRKIHANNRNSERARAGQRCAINITGSNLKNSHLSRGDWLVGHRAHFPVRRFDARLRILSGVHKSFMHWTNVHVHLAATKCLARVAVLGAKEIAPGKSAYVQLVLETPINARHGDRFILRDPSARRTIAGGYVIDCFPPARGRARQDRLAYLAAIDKTTAIDALTALLDAAPDGINLQNFSATWNLTADEQNHLLKEVPSVRFDRRSGTQNVTQVVSLGRWRALREQVLGALGDWHEQWPENPGPDAQSLARSLARSLRQAASMDLFRAVLKDLMSVGAIKRVGLDFYLPDHRPRLTEAETVLWADIHSLLEKGGLRPPRLQEIADALDIKGSTIEAIFDRAVMVGLAHPITRNRHVTPKTLLKLAHIAEALASETADHTFDAAHFRDRSGIGRNLTIDVLEFFDRCGFTTRQANARRILKPAWQTFPMPTD